ncbi:hypothetical protein D3C85_1298480 [compost metagenome]
MADEIQALRVRLIDPQVVGHDRIVFTHLRFVITRLTDLDRVIEENDRVQPQRGDLVVAREESVAPAQRHRVFQVHVLDTA